MRTDYKDYVPSTEMKEYNMIQNENGTVSMEDATDYIQTGDKMTAGILNELSQNANWLLVHTKTDTVHELTGLSAQPGIVSGVFRATADYTKGDTFTVDGEAYTIALSNGGEASDGLFVSGACIPVIVDTEKKTVNFKAGGGYRVGEVILAAVFTESGTFQVPQSGRYRVSVFGKGADGNDSYIIQSGYDLLRFGSGGGAGGLAVSELELTKGDSYPITVSTAQSSFGSLLSATSGAKATDSHVMSDGYVVTYAGGVGGTGTGGNLFNESSRKGAAAVAAGYSGAGGGDGGAYSAEANSVCPYAGTAGGIGGEYGYQISSEYGATIRADGRAAEGMGPYGMRWFGTGGGGGGIWGSTSAGVYGYAAHGGEGTGGGVIIEWLT